MQARIILETQRDALRERLRRAVQEAYGAATADARARWRSDEGHDRVLVSLHPELDPAAPVGHDLAAAFTNLVDQAFTATFPGHPRFEPEDREVRPSDLAAVLRAVEAARQDRRRAGLRRTGQARRRCGGSPTRSASGTWARRTSSSAPTGSAGTCCCPPRWAATGSRRPIR